jgi:hypothetical protein
MVRIFDGIKKIKMKSASENLLRGLLRISKMVTGIVALLLVGTGVVIYLLFTDHPAPSLIQMHTKTKATETEVASATTEANTIRIVDGKDVITGLSNGKGLPEVMANCLSCHSAKLITQNRFTRDGWHRKIVWMQQTQGLWDLGEAEPLILDYLAAHYSPQVRAARRQHLTNVRWYSLPPD